MSQWFLFDSLYCCCFISQCVFLSLLSELVWKLAEEISLQSAAKKSKRFPSFGPPLNGNKSNAKKISISPKSKLLYIGSIRTRRVTTNVLVYHLPQIPGNFGWDVYGKRFFVSSHTKIPGTNGNCEKVVQFSRLGRSEWNFKFLEFRTGFML